MQQLCPIFLVLRSFFRYYFFFSVFVVVALIDVGGNIFVCRALVVILITSGR